MFESLPSYKQWQGFLSHGNLTKDSNKGITNIAYNCLNLPSRVTFSDGSTITYSYAADGTKLRTVHVISGTTIQKDYCANVVYENGVQKLLLTEEGYVDLSDNTYYYYLKDHQGNNRVVINSSGTVQETNHYYPFGGVFASSGNVQPYKYNGKELDTKKGLNWYDYGARHYDAALGRFITQDRFAEKYYALSPYQYGANSPFRYIDINGDSIAINYKGVNIFYNGGNLYNADGSKYSGKIKSFLKAAIKAIEQLNKTDEGFSLVKELQESKNLFIIKRNATNSFKSNNSSKSSANISELQSVTGNSVGSAGSGGTIFWNPSSKNGGLDTKGNTFRPSYIGLGHEMIHASDANNGMLYPVQDYTNVVTGKSYMSKHEGLEKVEWRAVYRENILRKQSGISLRSYYGYDVSSGIRTPIGPRLLDSKNMPLKYE